MKISNSTKGSEYERLKKECKMTRTAGIILLCIFIVCYPALILSRSLGLCLLFALLGVVGLALTVRSFAHSKFACLKNKYGDQTVKENTQETNTSAEPIQPGSIENQDKILEET